MKDKVNSLGKTMMKKLLGELTKEKAPGPYPSFSVLHVIKAVELMAKRGPIGRGKLSEELEIGEGATRTLINRLKDAKLTIVTKPGCSLTKKGKEIWNQLQSIFPQRVKLEKSELTLATYNVAVLAKNCGHKVGSGIRQRDAAVMAGAKGATTLIFRKQKLILPTVSEDIAQDFPAAFNQITKLLKLEENDAVVIGSADSLGKAEYGALAASWSLINNNHN